MLSRRRLRVLYVDNNEDAREMLITLLGIAEIEVITVGTAAQALALIETEVFDLYVLEAWLPEVDGFELCRRMRALDPNTQVLFFSGAAYEADRKKGLEAGADAYVVKPNIDDLVGNIMKLASATAKPGAELIRVAMSAGKIHPAKFGASELEERSPSHSQRQRASRG
jgi:DNA-binding response OmpR family regulator